LKGSPSIAAVVASKDNDFAQWTVSLQSQLPDDKTKKSIEHIVELKAMVEDRIKTWRDYHNGTLPRKLVFYRDGVSETQFAMVQTEEVAAIEDAISELYDDRYGDNDTEHPQLLLICTIKRHHTRFFPKDGSSVAVQDRAGNPKPGCLVDSTVTLLDYDNFYLQSHKAIQGTARPTHYVVLHNSHNLGIKQIEKMTFNLCYLYGRSVCSVGLVPASYYADLVCDRARHYFRRAYVPFAPGNFNAANFPLQPHGAVKDRMFFI
jgi:eukaryotic translation initiation factor 2C